MSELPYSAWPRLRLSYIWSCLWDAGKAIKSKTHIAILEQTESVKHVLTDVTCKD